MSKREETREKIVEAAAQLFHRYGLEKTSMDDIAKRAQKAKGSLYYYFESKEELFKIVVAEELESIKQQLETVVNNSSVNYLERLKQYLILRMQLLKTSLNYIQILKMDIQIRLVDENKVSLLEDIKSSFDKWEMVQMKKIVQGCLKSMEMEMPQTLSVVNVAAVTDMIVMIIKSVEIQLILQNKYKDYISTFNFFAEMIISNLQNMTMNNTK